MSMSLFHKKYPFIVVEKSNNYVEKITNLLNETQNIFNFCVIFTTEPNKWDSIDNKIHLFKYEFNTDILKNIKTRQRVLSRHLENDNENYNETTINKINLTIVFDDTNINDIDKLYCDNGCYLLRLIYATNNEIPVSIVRLVTYI